MPSVHSPSCAGAAPCVTNPAVAFTEGFAEFLPDVTLSTAAGPNGGQYEAPGTNTLLKLRLDDTHEAMEGEVTGLLWDLFDPAGVETLLRPALTTADGQPVPPSIQDASSWNEELSDPQLERLRRVLAPNTTVPFVNTAGEFLDAYRRDIPSGELHGLKAIAFNRGLTVSMPSENAATLAGDIVVAPQPLSLSGFTMSITLQEPDPEDRPSVRVSVWHQTGNAPAVRQAVAKFADGWNEERRAATINFGLPFALAGTSERLFIVVNDDMLPTVYVVSVPRNISVRADAGALAGAVLVNTGKPTHPAPTPPSPGARRAADDMRRLVREGTLALGEYWRRKELLLGEERWLYRLARLGGELTTKDRRDEMPPALWTPAERTTIYSWPEPSREHGAAAPAFKRWMDQNASGRGPNPPLTAAGRDALESLMRVRSAQLRRCRCDQVRAAQLVYELRRALGALRKVADDTPMLEDTRRSVGDLVKALERMRGDGEMRSRIRRHDAVFQALAARAVVRR